MSEPSVFISYNGADREIARGIANSLKAVGMRVWIDEGELLIGDSLFEKIAFAIRETDFLVALVSENSISSNWCQKEIGIASTYGIKEKRVKVLPILIGDPQVPPTLIDLMYEPIVVGQEGATHGRLIKDITRHFYSPINSSLGEIASDSSSRMRYGDETSRVQSQSQGNSQAMMEQEGNLLQRMDLSEDGAIVVSLSPSSSTRRPISAKSLEELRQRFMGKRVIPISPSVSWSGVTVGKNRYIFDGGSGGGGYEWCAADLYSDGSGVYAFWLRDADNSNEERNLIFDDESVVACALGGLSMLGEYASNYSDSNGPYSVRITLYPSNKRSALIPGHGRDFFGARRKTWSTCAPSDLATGSANGVPKTDIFPPSSDFIRLLHLILSDVFQTFGIAECPQLDSSGRVRSKYWSGDWKVQLLAWAGQHDIESTEETL